MRRLRRLGALFGSAGRQFRRLAQARDGVSAIEFAFIGSILVVMLLNVVDFAFLIWTQMQVDYAAAAGAQAAYTTCSAGKMPATANCPSLGSAVTTAAQSTSLGGGVNASFSERYFCTVGTTLQPPDGFPLPPPVPPANCSAVPGGDAAAVPGDYVTVTVNYTFRPLFAGLSFVPEQTIPGIGMQRLQ